MSNPQMLDYTIIGKQKFYSQGQTRIQNITNKNTQSSWTTFFSCKQVQINLKLKNPSIVITCEIRVIHCPSLTLIFKDAQQKILQTKKLLFPEDNKSLVKSITSKQKVQYVDVVLSTNSKKQEILSISYLLIKGIKQQPKHQNHQINNLSKNHVFQNQMGKKKVASSNVYSNMVNIANKNFKRQNEMFSNRQKQKQNFQQKPKPKQKEQQYEQDTQLQKAILQSQRQYKIQHQKTKLLRKIQESDDYYEKMEIQSGNTQPLGQDYQLIKFKDANRNLMNVSHKWLQAQRRAEQDFKIKEQHKLSNYLQVRFFTNINFWITNDKKSNKLLGVIQQLGGKIIQQPKEYCYVIAQSKDNQKVRKALQLKGVKALNENFVFECKKCNALLQAKDYYLRT